jgi:hypothetical protein
MHRNIDLTINPVTEESNVSAIMEIYADQEFSPALDFAKYLSVGQHLLEKNIFQLVTAT